MGKKTLKGDALINKVALIVIEIISCSLIFGYISDYMTGNSELWYFILFEICAVTTALLVCISYFKFPEKMRYIAIICFSIVYLIANLGASTDVAFVMGFPIAVVFMLYYDYKLISAIAFTFNTIVVLDCIFIIFVLKKLHSGVPINSSVLLMEFLGSTIFFFTTRVMTKISNRNNEEKINTIKATADKVNESIHGINDEIHQLNKASEAAKLAMEEINTGISNTADAVQHQLIQTQNIQDKIENVHGAANQIDECVGSTLTAVEIGNKEVTELVKKSDVSVEISSKVSKDLEELNSRVEAMGSITKMIENIAFKTNLMALNANIEAAHAGELGRGFAVVATEISNMASQTKDATDEISDLISNAMESLSMLSKSIVEMEDVIIHEKEKTTSTSKIFTEIKENSEKANENIGLFMDYIKSLEMANREIVQSVETISATSEEVSALSSEALNMESANAKAVENIAVKVKSLAE